MTMHYWQAALIGDAMRLRAMQPGWDGPGSGVPSSATINRMVSIVTEALSGVADARPPYLVPAGDGSLQAEWDTRHAKLEFCICRGAVDDCWGHKLTTGEEQEAKGEDALAMFRQWAPWCAAPDFISESVA